MAEEMRLESKVTVGVPLGQAWQALTNLATFAAALPVADLHPGDDAYTGRVTLGSDGTRIVCEATLRAVDQDDDEHVSTVLLHARQVDGPAIGSAILRSRCESADNSTQVHLSAEVLTSGHEQTGESLQRAAQALFEQVSQQLERQAATAPPPPAPAAAPAATPGGDSGSRLATPPPIAAPARAQRGPETGLAVAAGMILVIAFVRWLLGRRRSTLW